MQFKGNVTLYRCLSLKRFLLKCNEARFNSNFLFLQDLVRKEPRELIGEETGTPQKTQR